MEAKIVDTDANDFRHLPNVDEDVFDLPIVFAFTTRGNDVYSHLVTYLLQQKHVFKSMSLVTATNTHKPSCDLLFDMCLQVPFEYLHMLDSDVAPRKDTTARLLSHRLDVVASPVYFYDAHENSIHLNVHYDEQCRREFTPKGPADGLEKVFHVSFASTVIHRRVIEMFKQTEESYTTWSPLIPEPFKRAAPDGIFFAKVAAFGFDVYIDWACEFATHHKYVGLGPQVIETFVAHRVLDREIGPERKLELLSTAEGRAELAAILQRGRDPVPAG